MNTKLLSNTSSLSRQNSVPDNVSISLILAPAKDNSLISKAVQFCEIISRTAEVPIANFLLQEISTQSATVLFSGSTQFLDFYTFSIEDFQLLQSINCVQAIVGSICHWISSQIQYDQPR